MIKTVRLLGAIGRKFGREFKMAFNRPAEAIRSLCAQLPGFSKYLYDSGDRGIQYRVVNGDPEGVDENGLLCPAEEILVIAPIASGSGGNFGKILLGAVIIGVAIAVNPGAGAILGIGKGTIIAMGASMMIGGVAGMLAATARSPKNQEKKDSFLFDRAGEVGKQGSPVPLLVGERIINLDILLSSGNAVNEIPV